MAFWTYEVATEFNFPNITIYKRLKSGVQTGWRMNAGDGYVFYDTTANNIELDPDTLEEKPVNYYYRVRYLQFNHDFINFKFVAVPEDSVDENYIFGTSNNHETA